MGFNHEYFIPKDIRWRIKCRLFMFILVKVNWNKTPKTFANLTDNNDDTVVFVKWEKPGKSRMRYLYGYINAWRQLKWDARNQDKGKLTKMLFADWDLEPQAMPNKIVNNKRDVEI